ncbi:MAG TPA: ATP-binding protein [Kofleriaceae bacterium]|nr:ATP-binding protein [Kofleriaceae bacterium]
MTIPDRELSRMFDHSPIGMYRCDREGTLRFVNLALVKLLGYASVDELLAQNLSRDIHVDAEERMRLMAYYRPLGSVHGARMRWRTKQGRHITVQIYGHVIELPDGPIFDISVLDVSELESANAELRKQREVLETTAAMLDMVVHQMTAIYWIVDRDLRICQAGGAIQKLLGFAPGRFIGMTIDEMHQLDPSTVDSRQMHRRALAGETVTFASQLRNLHIVTTVCPHRSGDEIVGAIGTCVDVTSHYLLERRIVDAQRAESLGVLAGGLAHDFNNMLAAILGNADLALRELAPRAPGRAPLENIRQASLRAAELTDQLLAYAGRRGVSMTRVAPIPMIDELLRISAATMPANVGVRIDIQPEAVMRGDASQIRQVLMNLINNARDALAARGGLIEITGRLCHHDGTAHPEDALTAPSGNYVELEIADNGPGMTHETRSRIFEPFFTTKPAGHGLGLAAVLGVVRAHGGGLRVETSPGKGSRFHVLWPSTGTPAEQPAVSPPSNGHTVLIIDDEDLIRDVVARMIEDLGYAAITATDAPAGLAIVDNLPIDAVLIDLATPPATGAHVVTALRQRRPDLPIILCCSGGRDSRAAHDVAYLPKPFRIDTLDQTLSRLLPRPSSS